MKSKLVFRVLGALASALIIASVFIPFVSVTGYSQSLWETHNAVGTIYLPIMIIVFGVVGVLVFSTGFKTELAYASAGGLLFFLIMQTIPVIDQNLINTLGVGYYCLAIGTLLIIIMAFICGLRVKQKVEKENVVEDTKTLSMIDQIDKLYNDQTESQNLNEINSLDNIIQPLPISEISQMSVQNNIQMQNNVAPSIDGANVEPISLQDLNSVQNESLSNQTSVLLESESNKPNVNVLNNVVGVKFENTSSIQEDPINFQQPVMQNLENSNVINPVIAQFNVPTQNLAQEDVVSKIPNLEVDQVNSVVSEFSEPVMQNLQNNNVINPVISQFNNQKLEQPSFMYNNNFQNSQVNESLNEVNGAREIKPLDIDNRFDIMGEPTNNNSDLDIFR
jgi:hypothetical protein